MFTVEDNIFPNTWIQFSNPKLKQKKSQLVTFTSVKLNERKLSHCKYLITIMIKIFNQVVTSKKFNWD